MRSLLRGDPFREMAPLFQDEPATFMPAFEVKESKEGYLFKADVPGIKADDLDITANGSRLTVSGHRELEKEDKQETYYAFERSYGSFSRSFTLPDGCDLEQVKADLRDGVLTLLVPRRPEVQPRKISLRPDEAKA